MIRLLFGLALMPSSILSLAVAARALAGLATRVTPALPFLVGLTLAGSVWLFARYCTTRDSVPARWAGSVAGHLYVFGHELTHAIAAWSVGAKVLDMEVGESSGHVDLSHSNAVVALAPYCIPFYALVVVVGYRALLWFKPGTGGQTLFLVLMGLTLSFHFLKTFESLWDRRQPDLAAAGGVVFSLAWILLVNGLVVLLLLKALFPQGVVLAVSLQSVMQMSVVFWKSLWQFVDPLRRTFLRQIS